MFVFRYQQWRFSSFGGMYPSLLWPILYGRRFGALAGVIGMALFDVHGRLVLMGTLCTGHCRSHGVYGRRYVPKSTRTLPSFMLSAMTTACIIKVIGHYGAEGIILRRLASARWHRFPVTYARSASRRYVLPVLAELKKYDLFPVAVQKSNQ